MGWREETCGQLVASPVGGQAGRGAGSTALGVCSAAGAGFGRHWVLAVASWEWLAGAHTPAGQALALLTCLSPSPLLPLCPQGLARGSRWPVLPGGAWPTSSPHRGCWKLALVLSSNVAVPTPGREGRPSTSGCTCPPRCDGDAHPQPPADFPESACRAGASAGPDGPASPAAFSNRLPSHRSFKTYFQGVFHG